MISNSSRNHNIDAGELNKRLKSGEKLNKLDVREVIEYHTYNIGGLNLPLARLPGNLNLLTWNKDEEIIVICKIGLRSQTAAAILKENGYLNVRNLKDGLMGLRKAESFSFLN
jgi:adenylyltransferase/sulfurtransferase